MEGDLDSETHRRPSPPVASNTGCFHHLTRSNSDASSLTAENCKDSFRLTDNVMPDECPAWTNEKHNSYLYDLEMSFVKQLYQSKSVLAHCSGHNLRDMNISRKRSINLNNASEQDGCWQNINCAAGEHIYSSTSADSHASLESRTHHSKLRGMLGHPLTAKPPTLLKLTEGTGQNFLDEEDQTILNFDPQKRLKTALGDGSHQDQISPSKRCPNPICQSSTILHVENK